MLPNFPLLPATEKTVTAGLVLRMDWRTPSSKVACQDYLLPGCKLVHRKNTQRFQTPYLSATTEMSLILGLKPTLPSSWDKKPLGSNNPDCWLAWKIESPHVPNQWKQEGRQRCDGKIRNIRLEPKQPAHQHCQFSTASPSQTMADALGLTMSKSHSW